MRSLPLFGLLLLLALPAWGIGGVLEINQTCAVQTGCFPSDAPGLPVEITEPGSYRLTGRLNANGSAVSAIEIRADDVTLDLGGFTVGFCQGLNIVFCQPGGSAPGIDGVGAAGVTVRNGIVADFAGVGVTLGPRAHVEDLLVRGNGGGGIRVLQDSLVESNRVFLNPGFGISFGTASGWGSNVLRSNGTNFLGEPVALSQNACSGRPCQVPGRRYYLSEKFDPFATRETNCDAGFRVPNAQELTNPSSLVYDDGRGVPLEDLFVSDTGWVDVGGGPAICAQYRWSETGWDFITANIASPICTTPRRSWCIED